MDKTTTDTLGDLPLDPNHPVQLFAGADHRVYWLGITEETAFRCNTYLIVDGGQGYLVDPGNRSFFAQVMDRVSQVLDPQQVRGMIICHQDPDVAASMLDWLAFNPDITVFTSPRTQVLLPHYGASDYDFYDVESDPRYPLPSGACLDFVGAPFLHSPMAFATYDEASRFVFSGDVFAAVDADWRLVVDDFDSHALKMDLFHLDYMASNVASRGFARKLEGLDINAILPQHGSLIPRRFVPNAIDYLNNLQCGLDVLYPDLG